MKVKKTYEEMKVENITLVKWVCEQLILIGNVQFLVGLEYTFGLHSSYHMHLINHLNF